jgi:hypothetical protein
MSRSAEISGNSQRRQGLKIASPSGLLTVSVTFAPGNWKRSPNRFARADTDSTFWPCSLNRTLPPRLTYEG